MFFEKFQVFAGKKLPLSIKMKILRWKKTWNADWLLNFFKNPMWQPSAWYSHTIFFLISVWVPNSRNRGAREHCSRDVEAQKQRFLRWNFTPFLFVAKLGLFYIMFVKNCIKAQIFRTLIKEILVKPLFTTSDKISVIS